MAAPHTRPRAEKIASYRGHFWVPGEPLTTTFGIVHQGPLFVEWEVIDPGTRKAPLVLIHGGGGQGTDWLTTVDGRPGWARQFVEAGYPVYVVDRVGHGRSPYHPDVLGEMGTPFSYETAVGVFADPAKAEQQTAWIWGRGPGDEGLDQLVAGFGPLPADLAYSQQLDTDRLAALLDQLGPAVLVTHSAGGPVGWLVADRRPDAVRAIVALEPLGPPFAEFPGIGPLTWGLTAAPVTYEPPAESPEELKQADPGTHRIPAVAGKKIVVITGDQSDFVGFAPDVVEFLNRMGARAEQLHLPDHDVTGNGHGVQLEANSEQSAAVVVDWLATHVG